MEWIMNWWWVTILGPIVLAVVIAYALLNRRRLTPEEKAERHRAMDRLYSDSSDPTPTRK